METLENIIFQKSLELGYENCGIIKTEDTDGYANKLSERIERTPKDAKNLVSFFLLHI